jgi:1-acyl-sn-glycerol-3-phosphate acyltransferase
MALKAQAPVVPVAIKGARNAMRKGSPLIYPVRVTIRFGTPIETSSFALEDRDRLVSLTRSAVDRLLTEA